MEKTNQCPFNPLDVCHGKVDARFIVMRSTCLTVQQLIKERSDKSWLTDRGIMAKTLIAPQEMVHHVLRFLYREAMTPRRWVQAQIDAFQARVRWAEHYVIGIHIRTGGMGHEGTRWGRFLNAKDVAVFKAYAAALTHSFENGAAQGMNLRRADPGERDRIEVKMKARMPVLWYVVSDQDAQKEEVAPDDVCRVGTVVKIKQIANNPSTPDSTLNKIVKSNDWDIAPNAAANPNASEKTKFDYLDSYLKAGCPSDTHGNNDHTVMDIGQNPGASDRIKKKYGEIEKYWSENPL